MENNLSAVKIAGIDFPNPLILASGVAGTSPAGLKGAEENGAGAVTTKSLGIEPRSGHPSPNVVEVEGGYLNAMGLPNPGVEEFARDLESHDINVPIIGSIYGESREKFIRAAKAIVSRVNALELNLSCPHANQLGAAIGVDPDLTEKVTAGVVGEVNVPVFAKLTPNVTDITKIGKAVESAGADGVVAINTLPGMAIDVETHRPVLGNRYGGLSGSAIHPVAVKSVYDLYESISLPIIGSGGVTTGEGLIELILAGATAVQVGTAVFDRGLDVFRKLGSALNDYLSSREVEMTDIIGEAHNK